MNSLGSHVAAVSIHVSFFVLPLCIHQWQLTSHVGEFLAATLEFVAVFRLDGILDGTGDRVVDTQDGTLDQLDLPGGIPSQTTTCAATARGSPGSLPLAPSLCGRSLTSGIRGSHSTGHTKGGCGVIAGTVGIVVGCIGSVGLGQTVS